MPQPAVYDTVTFVVGRILSRSRSRADCHLAIRSCTYTACLSSIRSRGIHKRFLTYNKCMHGSIYCTSRSRSRLVSYPDPRHSSGCVTSSLRGSRVGRISRQNRGQQRYSTIGLRACAISCLGTSKQLLKPL